MTLRRARALVLGTTVALWVALCAVTWLALRDAAAGAPLGTVEEYARTPEFQLANLVFGYLPLLLGLLLAALGVELLVFAAIRRARARARRADSD